MARVADLMALGAIPQAPSSRPSIPSPCYVQNLMLRRTAACSPNLQRQLSLGESDSQRHNSSGKSHLGGHHENSSKLSAKALVDPRARKWSLSSKHHSLPGHARDASNGRESSAVYGGSQADCQATRPITDQYRVHNAYAAKDNDNRLPRIRDFDKGLDDMNNVVRMRSSSLERGESSPSHNKGYSFPPGALNSAPPYYHCGTSQKGQYSYPGENLQTSRNQTQLRQDRNQYAGFSPQGLNNAQRKARPMKLDREAWQRETERINAMRSHPQGSTISVRTDSQLMTLDRKPTSQYGRQPPQGLNIAQKKALAMKLDREDWQKATERNKAMTSHAEGSAGSVRTDSQPTTLDTIPPPRTEEVLSMSNQGRDNTLMPTSAPLDGGAPMRKVDHMSAEENVVRRQDQSQYAHFPPQGDKIAQRKALAVKLDSEASQKETERINAMINHAEGSVGSVRTDSQPMTLGTSPASQCACYTPQGLSIASKKEALAMKLGSEDWQKEKERINAMRSHPEGSTCSVRTDTQPMTLDAIPSSRTEEVSSMSNRGRDNMLMLTSAALDSGAPMQKVDHVSVEENVPVQGPITRETEGKQVGLSNSNKITAAQNQGPHHLENRDIYSPKKPLIKQLISSEKVGFHSNIAKVTGQSDIIDTGGVSGNKFIQSHPDKIPSNEKDRKGRPLHMEDGGGCSIEQEKIGTPVTKGEHIGLDNGQDSAINEGGTDVMDSDSNNIPENLNPLYKKICIVDNVETAKMVAGKLMGEYKDLIHACDTEVAYIDIKKESPVGHGKIICFSIYCGSQADFGNGKSCVWVDVLGGGKDVLSEFSCYFGDTSIQKVWHNYSFDKHIIENHGIDVKGFHADTMHLARLWNSARSREGGYSLESLTKDPKVMDGCGAETEDELIMGKESMKSIFGKKKIKKDGTEGKVVTLPPVEELQITERIPWICYSALDAISTLRLWKSLKAKLEKREWVFQGVRKGNMYGFYTEYWRPFGDLLVQMESEGMLVDRNYLSEMEKVAVREQEISGSQFRKWASRYCPDACYMNVGSDAQVRQLLFGGTHNKKTNTILPSERTFKVPNVDNFIEEGKKVPSKFRNIVLRGVGVTMEVEATTPSGWPAVTGAALKTLAGKVSVDYDSQLDDNDDELPADLNTGLGLTSDGVKDGEKSFGSDEEVDSSIYGTAYNAFGGGQKGRDACHAIAALCEVSSINTLISNFLQPLQGKEISGQKGRVHCSLNINTETGRLSARKPNLQNQPALEKDRYKIRRAFIAERGNSLIVADYGQLELRILAHLSTCKSMLDAFKAGGDFHSRTAMNMYPHVREAVEKGEVLLEWDPQPGEEKPPIPLLKDLYATERRKAKMLNFSIAYGKTAIGLSKDWKVSEEEAKETVKLWYNERQEVLKWQHERKNEARTRQCVHTLLGRARHFPNMKSASSSLKGHIERAAINTPVQGSAADVAMCAMLEISNNSRLKDLGWKLLLQVHDEVILEGPTASSEEAKALVVKCMSYPFSGKNILQVDLAVDAKCALNWYEGK